MTVAGKNHCRALAILFFISVHSIAFGQLAANFTATPALSGCSPLVVNFTDQSTGSPNQWTWDLGNGVISLLQNPSTTYFNPGTYTVRLIVRNASGTDSLVKTNYITVFPSPTATFTAERTTGCFPLSVNFSDGSTPGTGTITDWFWDFGDGTTSPQQHPSHVYTAAGNYTVTLRVTNSSGCTRIITRTQYITITNGVIADFTNLDPGPCAAPATVNFTNASTGPGPLSYSWIFGDGGTSTTTNPSHTYNTNGIYSVTLIAVSPQGCTDTIHKNNLINIGSINADFTGPDSVCVNESFSLTNTSSPTPLMNVWSFGNGTFSTDVNPAFSYSTPGNYTIKLVSNFGGCFDSITKQIFVSAKPQPAFDGNPKTFCSVPATVNFINQTTGSGTVLWNFGDGNTSIANNPSHTYAATGNYTVTLTVTNAAGCSETITHTDFVQINAPQVSIAGLPRNGCAPITISPVTTIGAGYSITNYSWNFGDGNSSTSATPSHTYNSTGTYTVTLVYTTSSGCTDSVVIPAAVRVGTKPTAAFTITPTQACAFQTILFTDNSTGNVDQWQWNFGDGGGSTQQNPQYQYSDTGWFNVQLIVYNNTCADTLRIMNAVHIKPPIAAFTLQNDCNNKYTKTFTDGSVGATSWFWNFGDGNTSTSQNPVHTYASPGSYLVRLTVSNDTCSHSATRTVLVIDEAAAFNTNDTIICRNQNASFTSSGINAANIASWTWNFGDGSSSSSSSTATHSYSTSGNYIVSLIITDLNGCSDTATLPITVYGPTANFTVAPTLSCLYNNNTTFTDASTTDGIHPIIKWIWNYGDGTIDSSGITPYQHSYATAGIYPVTFLVKDNFGCIDSILNPAAITISQPTADFFSVDSLSCTGSPIAFTNTSIGNGLQYIWSFGDGNISAIDNPTHNYGSIGTYSVKLVVTDQYGCQDSLTKPNYISISYPRARFTVSDSISTCPPLLVNFAHQSIDYNSISWNFGDGTSSTLDSPSHFYTAPGIYYVVLSATGPGGCTDTAMKRIEIMGPSGSFTYAPLTGCRPLTVNFTGTANNNATYTWDFADGTIVVTTDSAISHTYVNSGEFIPRLILTDVGGCSVPIAGTDTIKVTGVIAGFTMGTSAFCNDGTVQFSNTTVGNDFISGYEWNFGDGNTSSAQNPSHYYATPGTYTVSLLVTSQTGCRDSLALTDTVKVYANPIISIANDSSGCTPVTVSFNGVVNSGNASLMKWLWSFGNGQTDTLQNPATQVYGVANSYPVNVIATDNHGCSDTVTTIITAHPIPVTSAGPDVFICRGGFTTLNATGGATYVWNTSPSLSCTVCPSPLAAPTDSTQYVVTGSSQFGCNSSDSVIVRVHQPFTLTVGQGDTVCSGGVAQLRASGADRYTWLPSAGVANPSVGNTTANPAITTGYRVIASDNNNCFSDTGVVNILVWQYPVVDAGPDKIAPIGSTLTLQPTYSNDIITHQWTNPMQTLSCTNCPAPVVQTKGERNTYKISVMNAGGCESTDEITIYTICNGGNLFIPNTFSPNADGKNEVFYPRGSGLNKIKSLRIYNRWGEMVFAADKFDANDASKGWNGIYKGKALPPDVYVYTCEVICTNNEVLTYNGNVTLLK
jgi:gliding motility-associated-like protein